MEHTAKVAEMELAKSKQDLKDSIEIQEIERAKLGADLHDELGPTLSAVKLKVNSITSGASLKEEEIRNLTEMIDQTIINVRSLSHELYPNTLKEFGLPDAIQELLKRISMMTSVRFKTEVDSRVGDLDYPVQLGFYRIIQEFCNNSLKHSQCDEIELKLTFKESDLYLEIRDNGKGFIQNEKSSAGLGMKNMRMRAESINATFQLTSSPENGTGLQIVRKK